MQSLLQIDSNYNSYYSALLIIIIKLIMYSGSGASLVALTSSVDITSGEILCPNTHPVVFTCIAVEASFLSWQRNRNEIEPNFNIGDTPRSVMTGPYNLSLDEIHRHEGQVANMTSRLVVSLNDLVNGDRVTCKELVAQDSITLHYKLQGDCISFRNGVKR